MKISVFDTTTDTIPVEMLRQWCFCPRIVYYRLLLGLATAKPLWVVQGETLHRELEILFKRRNLSRFALNTGAVSHRQWMADNTLGIHGIIDMLIETQSAIFVVEWKTRVTASLGQKIQLCAYAMLAEKKTGKPSKIGFLLEGKRGKTTQISIDSTLRGKAVSVRDAINSMLKSGIKPATGATDRQCCQCEYINHCNDRCE